MRARKMRKTHIDIVILLTCARSLFWHMSKNIVMLTKNRHMCADRPLYLCDWCVLCVYQYRRAICRAEQSASTLFSVILICSVSPFFLSRAAVRRSFLAFSLSMYLGQRGKMIGSNKDFNNMALSLSWNFCAWNYLNIDFNHDWQGQITTYS